MIRPTATILTGLLLASTGLFTPFIPAASITGLIGVGMVLGGWQQQRRQT